MARPVGSKNKPKDGAGSGAVVTLEQDIDQDFKEEVVSPEADKPLIPFTGTARSMECVRKNGHPNFYLLTLTIEKGRVVHKLFSEPYAIWEANARMEMINNWSGLNLNDNWAEGRAWGEWKKDRK